MTALALYSPPALAPELAREVERLVAGPVRLPGINAEDPGMVLAPSPPAYHPDAQAEADTRRTALAQPADPQVIRLWAGTLAAGHPNAPRSEAEFAMWLSALIFTCGDDVPGAAWDAVSLRQAMREFKEFWPSAGKVFDLLEARAARLRAEIAAFDAVAKGERVPRGPAREAFGYVPPMPPPERPAHPSMPKHDPVSGLVRIDPAEVARQLAALGVALPNTDLLAARREVLRPTPATPEPDTPAEPEPDEFGGPAPPRLKRHPVRPRSKLRPVGSSLLPSASRPAPGARTRT